MEGFDAHASDGADALASADDLTRKHGILLVPAVTIAQLPLTAALLHPKPYPWGELHVTARAFTDDAFGADESAAADACAKAIASMVQPSIRVSDVMIIEGRKSGRNNLCAVIESKDLHRTVHSSKYDGVERFTRDALQSDAAAPSDATPPTSFRATIGYGVPADLALDEAARKSIVDELNGVPWELALVLRVEGNGCRMLEFYSRARGQRKYYTDAV